MRLLELEIKKVRGVLDLTLKPGGDNLVVCGPNGSGKSAVVDALDFLLTGRITRLTGKGTGGISLAHHGPHIDSEAAEATVRALIQLPGYPEPFELQRCIGNPNDLSCKPDAPPDLEAVIALARNGHHILTRREILKFVTAEGSTRAEEIQHLLNITEIEEIRKALVSVRNTFDTGVLAARGALQTAQSLVAGTLGTAYSKAAVLGTINSNRVVLGGQPLEGATSRDLKVDLRPPAGPSQNVNLSLFRGDLTNLTKILSASTQDRLSKDGSELRELVEAIQSNTHWVRELSLAELIRLAIPLLDESGACPLCETPWPDDELRRLLERRLASSEATRAQQDKVRALSQSIVSVVETTSTNITSVVSAAVRADCEAGLPILRSWLAELEGLRRALADPIVNYPNWVSLDVGRLASSSGTEEAIQQLQDAVEAKVPDSSAEQNAWDMLTRLEENLRAVETAEQARVKSESQLAQADVVQTAFQGSRDKILGQLYTQIGDRFVELYRTIHGPDEDGFAANLRPAGAALDFEVDFYGRGSHPPHALHSEGHQDSMGLCLYLSLAERLTGGKMELVILDDVVMSIDADHRRQVCRLLTESFPGKQFLITTHDRTWANQLKSEGVVKGKGLVEFFNWSVEAGPSVNYESDVWERIAADLERGDVPPAAARLRRHLEQFFAEACDALDADVPFKLNGRWELGDFSPAATGKLLQLVRQAKNAAQTWGNEEAVGELETIEAQAKAIIATSRLEEWSVNSNVHYNEWAHFVANDFRPVVEAFENLCGVFHCPNCQGLLRLSHTGPDPDAVRCLCGRANWNLVRRTGPGGPAA